MPSILSRMADQVSELAKRQSYYNCPSGYYSNGYGYCQQSGWYGYGRWILLGVILFVAFVVFFGVSCLNARRRRKRGVQPVAGTGWMAPPGHGQAVYYNNDQSYPMNNNTTSNQQSQQPPNYAPPAHTGGANADYYGQEGGVTAPANSYQPNNRAGENVYAPPAGPPPGKKY